MAAPSETAQRVTRSFWISWSAEGQPLRLRQRGAERAVAQQHALAGFKCDSPWPVSLLWMLRNPFKSSNVMPSNP
jgi:hypothetical protein